METIPSKQRYGRSIATSYGRIYMTGTKVLQAINTCGNQGGTNISFSEFGSNRKPQNIANDVFSYLAVYQLCQTDNKPIHFADKNRAT